MKFFLDFLERHDRKRIIMDRICNEPYFTLILAGGYYEWVPVFNTAGQKINEIRYWRGPGHFRICGSNSYHRIELKEGVTAWTLFMPGPQKREWGFLVDNKWIPNEEYLNKKKLT